MAIINQRWPSDLAPVSCKWGRSRNDLLSVSPRTRQEHLITAGRPLWQAEMAWAVASGYAEGRLRYLLDGLEGYRGSVDIWDFASKPNYPASAFVSWTAASINYAWTWFGSSAFWNAAAAYTSAAGASAGATSVTVQGLTPSQPVAVQGAYVQIGRRLYILASSVVADSGGNAVLPLTTPLLATMSGGAAARLQQAGCEMRMLSQQWSADNSAGQPFWSVSVQFQETVEDYS